ncbi:MAG: transglutaminase family protein [Verrucomicrobiota bacterium]
MATYHIKHKTIYSYRYPVASSHHTACLRPLDKENQKCRRFHLRVSPDSSDLIQRQDYFSNIVHIFSIQEPHDSLVVNATSLVESTASPQNLKDIDTPVLEVRKALADIDRTDLIDAKQFLYETEYTAKSKEILDFGNRFFEEDKPIGAGLFDMLEAFSADFEFDPEVSDIYTPIQTTLLNKRGVCQDFAHLMIGALRAQGLAACYASGYILTQPPPGQERLMGADASHAWVSVFVPEAGWINIDPTNNLVCGDQHVSVAYGRDFSDVSMIKGAVTGGGEHSIDVQVTMELVES